MQSDEIIWQIINHQFCSFKAKLARERAFCTNQYNVTGLCLRSACPLANSSYATIREIDGICYLFIKTAERAHTPNKLWEKTKLPANYVKALELVSTKLEHFPKYLVHRNKQRLTKIHQMLIRMRKLKLKARPKLVTTSTRNDQVEVIRERKALKAANLDRAIENELLERLRQVSETEIYNYPEKQYSKALKNASKAKLRTENEEEDEEEEEEQENEEELEDEVVSKSSSKISYKNARAAASKLVEEEDEDELEDDPEMNELEDDDEGRYDIDDNYNVEFVEDFEESDDEEDVEDAGNNLVTFKAKKTKSSQSKSVSFGEIPDKGSRKRKADKDMTKSKVKGPRVEIEYEEDEEERPTIRNQMLSTQIDY